MEQNIDPTKWWTFPRQPIYTQRGHVLPNNQRRSTQKGIFEPPRTIVAVWSKTKKGELRPMRQYTLWSSGQLQTRLVFDREAQYWKPRRSFTWTYGLTERLDKFFKASGYTTDYMTSKRALKALVDVTRLKYPPAP